MRGGSVVMDWDQIVRHLSVSSNEGQAYRLTDGTHTTFWQSSGTQGKVCTYWPVSLGEVLASVTGRGIGQCHWERYWPVSLFEIICM